MKKKVKSLADRKNVKDVHQTKVQTFDRDLNGTRKCTVMENVMKVEAHLKRAGFAYTCEFVEGDFYIYLPSCCFDLYHVCFRVRAKNKQIVMVSEFDETVPEDKKLTVAEFIIRINNSSPFGGFDMFFDEGVVRYSIKTRCTAVTFTFDRFTEMFGDTFFMVDSCKAGLAAIYDEGKNAVEAFKIAIEVLIKKNGGGRARK